MRGGDAEHQIQLFIQIIFYVWNNPFLHWLPETFWHDLQYFKVFLFFIESLIPVSSKPLYLSFSGTAVVNCGGLAQALCCMRDLQ